MADHYEQAARSIDRAHQVAGEIVALVREPDHDPKEVGRLANRERAHWKRAEVHALMAIAQRLDDVRLPS